MDTGSSRGQRTSNQVQAQKLVHRVWVIVNLVLNQLMMLMAWDLGQTETGYPTLLPEFPTILPLLSGPQLTLQGKNCQVWTSFLSHCKLIIVEGCGYYIWYRSKAHLVWRCYMCKGLVGLYRCSSSRQRRSKLGILGGLWGSSLYR